MPAAYTPEEWAAIVEVANRAIVDGSNPAQAIADLLGLKPQGNGWTSSGAYRLLGLARERGLIVEAPVAPVDTAWMDRAACRGCDPNLWFPERGEDTSLAKAVCASCPVAERCLDYALALGEKNGIWGGVAERQRRRMRRENRLEVAS